MRIKNAVVHDQLCIMWVSATEAELTKQVRFSWDDDDGPQEFIALEGVRFDSASVPWFLQWFLPRWGVLNLGALIHDCAFRMRFQVGNERVSRKYADQLLYVFARATGVDPLRAYAARYAVRWFGERLWDRHDKEFRT